MEVVPGATEIVTLPYSVLEGRRRAPLPRVEGGLLAIGQRAHAKTGPPRDDLAQGGWEVPSHAAVLLQESIDGKLRGVPAPSGQDQVPVVDRANQKAVLVEPVQCQPGAVHKGVTPDVNDRSVDGALWREFRAGHFLQNALELVGGPANFRGRLRTQRGQRGSRLSFFHDRQSKRCDHHQDWHGRQHAAAPVLAKITLPGDMGEGMRVPSLFSSHGVSRTIGTLRRRFGRRRHRCHGRMAPAYSIRCRMIAP